MLVFPGTAHAQVRFVKRLRFVNWLRFAFPAICAAAVFAQAFANISGQVTDSTGSSIPAATVVVQKH